MRSSGALMGIMRQKLYKHSTEITVPFGAYGELFEDTLNYSVIHILAAASKYAFRFHYRAFAVVKFSYMK